MIPVNCMLTVSGRAGYRTRSSPGTKRKALVQDSQSCHRRSRSPGLRLGPWPVADLTGPGEKRTALVQGSQPCHRRMRIPGSVGAATGCGIGSGRARPRLRARPFQERNGRRWFKSRKLAIVGRGASGRSGPRPAAGILLGRRGQSRWTDPLKGPSQSRYLAWIALEYRGKGLLFSRPGKASGKGHCVEASTVNRGRLDRDEAEDRGTG